VVRPKCAAPTFECGFTYIGLLITVVIMGLMLTVVARVWTTTERREREAQLLWVGHQYRQAIGLYYARGRRFPAQLQDLLTDERTPVPKHHLRRLYPDPITGNADWTLVPAPDGGIIGVASRSQAAPIKRDGFEPSDGTFKDADCYCSWKFIYYPNRFYRVIPVGPTPVVPGALNAPSSSPAPAPQTPDAPSGGSTP
jgi:type II secretory pathway pseudopilin PulG